MFKMSVKGGQGKTGVAHIIFKVAYHLQWYVPNIAGYLVDGSECSVSFFNKNYILTSKNSFKENTKKF